MAGELPGLVQFVRDDGLFAVERKARELGLITVQNRGRLTNVVRIIAPEWLAWLQLGDGERRRLVDTRLTASFKDRYSVQEIEAVCKELDEAEQLGAIPAAEPSTVP